MIIDTLLAWLFAAYTFFSLFQLAEDFLPLPWDDRKLIPASAALAAAAVKLARDRGSTSEFRDAARLGARFSLAYTYLVYAAAKVFGLQLSQSYYALDLPFGSLSGMELTWNYFGHSPGYRGFIAGGQIAGSLLLLSARAWWLGALVLVPIGANIAAINFAYGIPVKLHSSLYTLMAVALVASDRSRLRALLPSRENLFHFPWWRVARWIAAGVVTLAAFGLGYADARADRRVTPLTGAWEVTGGEFGFPRAYFEEYGRGSFTGRNWFAFTVDETKQELRVQFQRPEMKGRDFVGQYEVRQDGEVIVTTAGRTLLRLTPLRRGSWPARQ